MPVRFGPIVQIAINAGKGQVIEGVCASVHFWDNVLDMERGQW